MPNDQDPGRVPDGRRRRLVRYRAMIKVRVERDRFASLFAAAKVAGASSTSAWIRRVLDDAAHRELDRHQGRQQPPPG